MVERITSQQFHDADRIDDWRVIAGVAHAHFKTGSFAKGLALVNEIGRLAETANHHPDIALRYPSVAVSVSTHEVDGLTQRDVDLATAISAAARDLDIPADPTAPQSVNLALDAHVTSAVLPFWRAVLAYDEKGDEDVVDPTGRGPWIWFQDMPEPRTERNRFHIDVDVPHDQAEARVAAALAAGGHIVDDTNAPSWWTLADSEGNEVDVATWIGRS